ncbi:MFS transporter [uncultured Parasutterella sp.]|jgi:Arabinose efflux permease|uniref:MFS transporter n=1 Tax=uncultured Parasutterella sp. TaxID=1263098 RepID=UPI0025B3FB73|nr:MFS transporter [uncultured Parasutterella sp.]
MKLSRGLPAVPFVLFNIFLDILGIGLIIPVLPKLVGTLVENAQAQAWWLGAMLIAYGFMQFALAPTLGSLSDKWGRRPILLLGVLGLGVMFFVPAFSDSLTVILLSRVLGGMFSANIAVAQAYIADVTPKEQRAAAFGKIGACFGVGFILGPAAGGLIGEYSIRLPFILAGTLAILNFFYGLFILPESLRIKNPNAVTFARCNPISSLLELGKFKQIGALLVVIALSSFVQSLLHSTWSLFTTFRFHWSPMDIGLSLVAIGTVTGIIQGKFIKSLLAFFGPKRLILFGLLSGAAAYLGFGLITVGALAYLIIVLNFLSVAVTPTLNGIVSEEVPSADQGRALGAVSALGSLMGVLAPLLGTPLLVHTSHMAPGSVLGGLPYIICSSLLLLAALIASLHFRSHPRA